jgi:methyl-accepting chemotaxis protein
MNTSEHQSLTSQLIRQSLSTTLRWLTPAMLVVGYLVGLALGLSAADILWGLTRIFLPVFLLAGVLLPGASLTLLVRKQLGGEASEEERLRRLVKLPWMLAVAAVGAPSLALAFVYATTLALVFERSLLLVGLGLLLGGAAGVGLCVPVALRLEALLMPAVLEAQTKLGRRPEGQGFFWPRQSWHLSLALGASLACAVPLAALVTGVQLSRPQEGDGRTQLLWELVPGLLVLGAFTLLLPALGALLLARRQARATAAIQASMEALTQGTTRAPQWASSDELGELSARMGSLLVRFRELPAALQAAAGQLSSTSAIMDSAGSEHRQAMEQQVQALQEAQVTSQEIRQTSALASRRVETVLKVVARAEQLGGSGEAALEKTLAGLSAIREFADGISSRVVRVQECAAQIGDITLAVKDLASQSNVLSINAAIEAARSGEHGSGFAVVAQEFRKLTDQSLRETVRIGNILEQVRGAVRELVTMSEQGSKQVEGGLEMVKASGESLRELSGIIQENAAAARMIASAVAQQDTGISQVFTAITQLAKGMDEAMQRMETTLEASRSIDAITQQVQEIARSNQVAG